MYLIISSAKSMSSFKSAKHISGSTIQNSAACLTVLEFSARNVGPNVYTLQKASANVSAFNWPLTVRCAGFPKKSWEKSTFPLSSLGKLFKSNEFTLNISPAPSASLAVIRGVFTYTNPFSWKNLCIAYASALLTRNTALNVLLLGRKCAIVLKYSNECLFFWSG